jgi:hypothetical protein
MVGSMIVFSGTKKEVEEAIAADPYVKAGKVFLSTCAHGHKGLCIKLK